MVVCTMHHQCSECSMKEKQCHGSMYNVSPVFQIHTSIAEEGFGR